MASYTEFLLEGTAIQQSFSNLTKLFAKLEAPVVAIKKLSKEDQVMAFLLNANKPMHVLKIRNLLNISAEATEEVVKRLIDAQKRAALLPRRTQLKEVQKCVPAAALAR